MADILTHSQAFQSSSAPTIASDQFSFGGAYQASSNACITDLTPPTFSGISALTVESRGQIKAVWAAASDPTPPIRYEVYIKASTSTGLFSAGNIIAITDKLQFSTFNMPDGSFLVNGTTYYVGVRAIDGVNNRDSNTAILNVISTGVFVSAEVYDAEGAFAINTDNQLQGTLWCLKNSQLAKTGNAVMGTASYQVYDKTGTAVPGMGESGITADANGQYKITPVDSDLSANLDHYMVKIAITVDGAVREGYVALIEPVPAYTISGVFAINSDSNLIGAFWASANGERVDNLARLGDGHYHIYDVDGNPISGMTQSGISPDANGQYIIDPMAWNLDLTSTIYFAHTRIVVDNIEREQVIPIVFGIPEYEVRAQFSINALNQFQATIWATANGHVKIDNLGTASYQVYDVAGNAVSGLTQTGITADANGRFHITAVSAALLTDLTHYNVKVTVVADGVERVSYKGFTLLGT